MSRFDTSATSVTTDNATGLTWTRGYAAKGEVTHAKAETAIKKLNEKKFAGFDDWRLPTVPELFGLVDRTRYAPAIDTDAFESGEWDWVWTSESLASSSDYVWVVNVSYGLVNGSPRYTNAFVRAVRGPSPAGQ
jgi:hypothetical protein